MKAFSPQFRAWFDNSKITDESGAPQVMYHGSPEPSIKAFNCPTSFTPEKSVAHCYEFANPFGDVYEVYLRCVSPFDIIDRESAFRFMDLAGRAGIETKRLDYGSSWDFECAHMDAINSNGDHDLHDLARIEQVAKQLMLEGYDSVRSFEAVGNQEFPIVIVLRPEQIKSVANRGAFDPKSPDHLQ